MANAAIAAAAVGLAPDLKKRVEIMAEHVAKNGRLGRDDVTRVSPWEKGDWRSGAMGFISLPRVLGSQGIPKRRG